jgi:hypothetical protein
MFVSFSFGVFLVISGLNLARDGSSRKLSLSTFTATRPVSTSSLLTAKLLAGGATWFLAVLTVAVTALWVAGAYSLFNPAFVPPGYSRFAAHQLYLPRDLVQGAILGLCLLAVSLHIFIGILPLSLSGKIPGFPWSLLPLLLLVGGISNAWMWFERHNWPMDLLCSLLSAMVTVKLLVAWWAFRRAINLGLVSWTLVAGYSLLWLVATGVFLLIVPSFAYLSGDLPRIGMPTASILAGLLSVPLARIALSPLALNLNRHR